MAESNDDRMTLLADVAEMYFLREKTQDEISRFAGVSRSMVSRLLNEARRKGIVEIKIRRPLAFNRELQRRLEEKFDLKAAYIIDASTSESEQLLKSVGQAGAFALKALLKPEMVLGVTWGTSTYAVVDALEVDHPIPVNVVQLVGALDSRNEKYDGHAIVQNLAHKLGGEPFYLNAPFQVESEKIAKSLLTNQSVIETFDMSQRCDLALLGIGSIEPKYSFYYMAGYLTPEEVDSLSRNGAIGCVCGVHFDRQGNIQARDFQKRLVSINEFTLKAIPNRIGVASGQGKTLPILGALRGGFINILITDSTTARDVIKLDAED